MTRSLQARLSSLPPGPESKPLRHAAMGKFFRAVGLITHTPYPVRRLEQLKETYQIGEGQAYLSVLSLALRDATSEEWREDGEQLLEQVFIEPLATIYHTFQEEDDKNDRV